MFKTDIVFYDIKTRILDLPTSPNTWRLRLVLNYKRLAYKTVWVEGPDIQSTCIAAGIPPLEKRADGSLRYTLPAIIDHTNPEAPVHLTESVTIIDYLEEKYPDPDPEKALYPKGTRAFQALAYKHTMDTLVPLAMSFTRLGMFTKQTDRTQVSFRKVFEQDGKTIEEKDLKGDERADAWKKFRAALDSLNAMIDKNGEGDERRYFAGKNPCFIDFHLASLFVCLTLCLDNEFSKEIGNCSNGRWGKLLDSFTELIK